MGSLVVVNVWRVLSHVCEPYFASFSLSYRMGSSIFSIILHSFWLGHFIPYFILSFSGAKRIVLFCSFALTGSLDIQQEEGGVCALYFLGACLKHHTCVFFFSSLMIDLIEVEKERLLDEVSVG